MPPARRWPVSARAPVCLPRPDGSPRPGCHHPLRPTPRQSRAALSHGARASQPCSRRQWHRATHCHGGRWHQPSGPGIWDLIGRFVSLKEALEVSKAYLINWHDAGQQPFATLHESQHSSDGLIAKCQAWIAEHYAEPSPVGAMTKISGLPDRTFIRRFVNSTGMTPLDYVHALRLEEAKQILETEDLSIEAIAEQVGYEDTSFFGRLFRRKVGLTPAQYPTALRIAAAGLAAYNETANSCTDHVSGGCFVDRQIMPRLLRSVFGPSSREHSLRVSAAADR